MSGSRRPREDCVTFVRPFAPSSVTSAAAAAAAGVRVRRQLELKLQLCTRTETLNRAQVGLRTWRKFIASSLARARVRVTVGAIYRPLGGRPNGRRIAQCVIQSSLMPIFRLAFARWLAINRVAQVRSHRNWISSAAAALSVGLICGPSLVGGGGGGGRWLGQKYAHSHGKPVIISVRFWAPLRKRARARAQPSPTSHFRRRARVRAPPEVSVPLAAGGERGQQQQVASGGGGRLY